MLKIKFLESESVIALWDIIDSISYVKLLSGATQITEYKTLDDGYSESDVCN